MIGLIKTIRGLLQDQHFKQLVHFQVQDDNKNTEYLCLSHNPFADVIAVGLDNGHIKLYDERTLQVTSLLKKSQSTSKVDGHTNRVFCITNHPHNPHEFVSAGWDNTLQVRGLYYKKCCYAALHKLRTPIMIIWLVYR